MVKEDQPDGAREKGPDLFMDEYAFILQQADDLTLVTTFWHNSGAIMRHYRQSDVTAECLL